MKTYPLHQRQRRDDNHGQQDGGRLNRRASPAFNYLSVSLMMACQCVTLACSNDETSQRRASIAMDGSAHDPMRSSTDNMGGFLNAGGMILQTSAQRGGSPTNRVGEHNDAAGSTMPSTNGTLAGVDMNNDGAPSGGTVWARGIAGSGGSDASAGAIATTESGHGDVYRLSVTNGFGSGEYRAGDVVHVWADVNPTNQLLRQWTGDVDALSLIGEWHTTLVMPAYNLQLTADLIDVHIDLTVEQFPGATRMKTVRYYIPNNPVGIVHFAHGTGGQSTFIESVETWYLALKLIHAGYAVWATDAEEVDTGDQDGNDKIRWDSGLRRDNPDISNIDALFDAFVDRGLVPQNLPRFAVGMSNGGAFSLALGATLNLDASISYCASGRAAAAQQTTSPTAWFLCENDDNAQVDNDEAADNHSRLIERGVASSLEALSASPLYDERFSRLPGIETMQSRLISRELRQNGHVDENGFFIDDVTTITNALRTNTDQYPALSALSPQRQSEIGRQIRSCAPITKCTLIMPTKP